MKAWSVLLAPVVACLLSSCVSFGGDAPPQVQYRLHDNGASTPRRPEPLVAALLIQTLAADATADTVAIAYARQPNEFAYYQFASWTERPARLVPRLLQQRLEARGIAGAVGLIGDPLHADWLLTIAIDTLHHDASAQPGQARVVISAELFDRRTRTRISRRRFEAAVPVTSADAPAAAVAMSQSLTQVFDDLVPWLEAELQQSLAKAAH